MKNNTVKVSLFVVSVLTTIIISPSSADLAYEHVKSTLGASSFSISSATWEANYVDALEPQLTDNPNTGGGLRIFPDRRTFTDTSDRATVRVVATLAKPRAGVPIYFKSLDVDDPSATYVGSILNKIYDIRTLDPGDATAGKPVGGDNRGTPSHGKFTITESNQALALTDTTGTAKVDFVVTMQPGDNFRVAVSTRASDLAKVTDDNIPAENSPTVDSLIDPLSRMCLTPMLTVWRRLHVERDSMRAPTGNENRFVGQIKEIRPGPNDTLEAVLDSTLPKPFQDDDQVREHIGGLNFGDTSSNLTGGGNGRFENGTIRIGTGTNITATTDLAGNGDNFARTKPNANFDIPYTIKMIGKATVQGNILRFESDGIRGVFHVSNALLAGNYDQTPPQEGQPLVAATLNIAGQDFEVQSNTENEIVVTTPVQISILRHSGAVLEL